MKKCPYCAEEIQDAAIVCRFCGRDIAPVGPAPVDVQPLPAGAASRGPWLLLAGIAFIGMLGFIAYSNQQHVRSLSSGVYDSASGQAGTSPTGVTMENYLRLTEGMTYSEVIAILGKPGTELSRSDLAGITTVMYMWEGSSLGANMNVMFQQGKLVQKAQVGLR